MNFKTALAVLGAAILLPTFGVAAQLGANIATPVISNQATPTPDVFRVNYFAHLEAGATASNGVVTGSTSAEEYIDIVNPGTNGADQASETNGIGDLCALIYVVDTSEELEECCGCKVTPDQLIELPVQANLLSNPNNGRVIHSGAIKIISSAPTSAGTCNPGAPNPTPTLREWITHTRLYTPPPVSGTAVTEVEFSYAALSATEQSFLSGVCSVIQNQSTGAGICSCATSAPF